jgi:hypothetical protein
MILANQHCSKGKYCAIAYTRRPVLLNPFLAPKVFCHSVWVKIAVNGREIMLGKWGGGGVWYQVASLLLPWTASSL